MSESKLNRSLLRDLVIWAAREEDETVQQIFVTDHEGRLAPIWDLFADWGEWKQSIWSETVRNGACQTAYCIAGQAVVQLGYGIIYERPGMGWQDEFGREHLRANMCGPRVLEGLDDKGEPVFSVDTDKSIDISTVARTGLGLDMNEADALFGGENTIGMVIGIANRIAEKRGVDLELPPEVREIEDRPRADHQLITHCGQSWFTRRCEHCGHASPWAEPEPYEYETDPEDL